MSTWLSAAVAKASGGRSEARVREDHTLSVRPTVKAERDDGTYATLKLMGRKAPTWAAFTRVEADDNGTGLFYWNPRAARGPCVVKEPPAITRPVPPLQLREDLGNLLEYEGMRTGVEVGVQQGVFSAHLLKRWPSCKSYLLVDLWEMNSKQLHYNDSAGSRDQKFARLETRRRMRDFPHVRTPMCANFSTACASSLADESVDFVYLDARHDYWGVLQDLTAYWPKVRRGGIVAGHDYLVASEHGEWRGEGGNPEADDGVNGDGTRDMWGRAVRGAIDDFFTHCVPRQVVVTYRDGNAARGRLNPVYNTWVVRK
jgi:hypothetical protein